MLPGLTSQDEHSTVLRAIPEFGMRRTADWTVYGTSEVQPEFRGCQRPQTGQSTVHQRFSRSFGMPKTADWTVYGTTRNGAEGGTRTPTGCPIRPSNVRVYQFHHFGFLKRECVITQAARLPAFRFR